MYVKPVFCFFKTCPAYAFRLFINERGIDDGCTNSDCAVVLLIFYDTKHAIITYICKITNVYFMYLRTESRFFYGFYEKR